MDQPLSEDAEAAVQEFIFKEINSSWIPPFNQEDFVEHVWRCMSARKWSYGCESDLVDLGDGIAVTEILRYVTH